MRISFSWLKEFLELSIHPEVLARQLTMTGCEVTALTQVDEDWILEMEVTPNRPDLLSHLGMARETAAVLGRAFRFPRWLKREVAPLRAAPPNFSVTIDDPGDCRRYVGVIIEGIQGKPSPSKLADRLTRLGIRPINNVVDVTNLCLLEFGQPLHAFDLDKLEGGTIQVRRADPREILVTIDGVSRPLTSEHLVIADARRPVALAGVMGGRDTEISPATRRVFLESAWFNPIRIRKAARGLKLSSESSYRFERGVDLSMVPMAALRAARQICALTGGAIKGGLIDVGEVRLPGRRISLRPHKAREVLGMRLYPMQQRRFLERTGCRVTGVGRSFKVEPPSWRGDLKIPEDLYEELARLWGYDRCPATLPPIMRQVVDSRWVAPEDPWIEKETRIRTLLAASGGQEILTYTLVNPESYARLKLPETNTVPLLNPLSQEYSVLRKTLLAGALETLARNLNRKTADSFYLFELGRVYRPDAALTPASSRAERAAPFERRALSLLSAGSAPTSWEGRLGSFGLFHLKGTVQYLCERLRLGPLKMAIEQGPPYLSGQAVVFRLGEKILGSAGRIDPKILSSFEISEEVPAAYAELDLELIAELTPESLSVHPLPKIPPVSRDLAIIIPEEISHEAIQRTIQQAGQPLLNSAILFDLYKGSQIPAGKKSLAFRLSYSAGDRTLTNEEVATAHQRIVEALVLQFKATLR